MFGDCIHTFGILSNIGYGFQNGYHIFERDTLVQQGFEYSLNQSNISNFGGVIDEYGVVVFDFVDERLCLLACEQFFSVFFDQFRHMCGDNGSRIHDGVAIDNCIFFELG